MSRRETDRQTETVRQTDGWTDIHRDKEREGWMFPVEALQTSFARRLIISNSSNGGGSRGSQSSRGSR